jgi:hypothetical protein
MTQTLVHLIGMGAAIILCGPLFGQTLKAGQTVVVDRGMAFDDNPAELKSRKLCVLAYPLVIAIEKTLRDKGVHTSWGTVPEPEQRNCTHCSTYPNGSSAPKRSGLSHRVK